MDNTPKEAMGESEDAIRKIQTPKTMESIGVSKTMTNQTATTGPDGTAGDSTTLVKPNKDAGDDNEDH
jgi:hypothetical protein